MSAASTRVDDFSACGVKLDQGPRLAPLHRSVVLHPFVERDEGVEPFFLLHDREQAADLEKVCSWATSSSMSRAIASDFSWLSISWTRSLIRSVSAALVAACAILSGIVTTSDFCLRASAFSVAASRHDAAAHEGGVISLRRDAPCSRSAGRTRPATACRQTRPRSTRRSPPMFARR